VKAITPPLEPVSGTSGAAVDEAGTGVAVGGIDVGVDGNGVRVGVGATFVAVAFTGVSVGGIGVSLAAMANLVGVAGAGAVPGSLALQPAVRSNTTRTSTSAWYLWRLDIHASSILMAPVGAIVHLEDYPSLALPVEAAEAVV
jgi:hypothetical protein